MKKTLSILLSILSLTIMAQVPQGVGYQGVATDANGIELVNQAISIKASVLSGSATGTVEWEETHATITDTFGLFTLTIGQGTNTTNGLQTSFADISWGTNTHFLKIEMDVTGGSNYSFMGTNQMMSVPYALYAESANINYDSISNFLSGDSTFITNVGGGMGGSGCDFKFPDGLEGDFISVDMLQGNYTVPTGKNLYILNAMTDVGYQWINLDGNRFIKYDAGYWQLNTATVMAGSGSVLSSQYQSSSPTSSTMFGYLADENYFANCGGGGSSSTSSLDSTTIANMIAGSGGGCNLKSPEGINGVAVTEKISQYNDSYTVPVGKRLYVLVLDNTLAVINGKAINKTVSGSSNPLILNSGDVLTASTNSGSNFNGYLADENYFAGCGGSSSSSNNSASGPVFIDPIEVLDAYNLCNGGSVWHTGFQLNVDSILNQNITNIILHSEFQASAGSSSYSNSYGEAVISSWNGVFSTPIMYIKSSNNGQATYNNDELTRIANQVTLPISNGILDIQISGGGHCSRVSGNIKIVGYY